MPSKKRGLDDMDEGSRKKLKREDSPPLGVVNLSSDKDMPAMGSPPVLPGPDHSAFQALQLLHADFDSLRSLVTCRICERLLYEPYVLSCGHTYCYSCLCTWFQGKKKKTCPNCRDVIRQTPAPSYVIKEMTSVFVGRAELLPDGETPAQHAQWQKEEADVVQSDKNNEDSRVGGLFRGCFNDRRERLGPIFDLEDNVERCPGCNWELEEGMCNRCGYHVDEDFGIGSADEISDDVSDELDEDEIDQDDFDAEDVDFDGSALAHGSAWYAGPPVFRIMYNSRQRHGRQARRHFPVSGEDEDDDEDEGDEDEDDHSMDGFIVDEAEESDPGTTNFLSSDADHSFHQPIFRHRRRRIVADSDEDEDEDEDGEDAEVGADHVMNADSSDEPSGSDTDSDIINLRRNPHSRGTAQPITIVDSDDEDLNSDSEGEQSERSSDGSEGRSESLADDVSSIRYDGDHSLDIEDDMDDDDNDDEHVGFSPMQPSVDEELDSDQGSDGEDDEHDGWR